MMKSVVAAAALLILGLGSAFAGQSQSPANHGTVLVQIGSTDKRVSDAP
jgi:hypothetical protein